MYKHVLCFFILSASVFHLCQAQTAKTSFPVFDAEAHRGGRGLMPENTIAAMKNAVGMPKVQTLEMDLVISKDSQVVVSHDPFFNPLITTTPSGHYLMPADAEKTLLFSMNYDNIKKYDVGLKPYDAFPQQKKTAAVKPLLKDLIDSVERYAATLHRTIYYNIEIKSTPQTDHIRHPDPATFVQLVIPLLIQKKILDRVVIQCFDLRPLQIIHRLYPTIRTSLLLGGSDAANVQDQVSRLGFVPFIYSPVYTSVTGNVIADCHAMQMKIVPWTINNREEMKRLVALGVDGLISDYPDLFDGLY